ncbi:MAG TPA: hypothetical protein H9675_01445 [Firmicutes bacterium]|nr:hypothetical protein [Bacillota bacterium]
MLGQLFSAYTNVTYGMTLEAVSLPYYRFILPYGMQRVKRFANTCGASTADKTDEQTALEGLDALESWMCEMELVMNMSELDATEEMIDNITDGTIVMAAGYKTLERDKI